MKHEFQILSIIGIIALLALAVTLIYYVIKGIAYLFYYILKGIYYLLKGIGFGIFKLCEGFYKLVSGELKANKQIENSNTNGENQFDRNQDSSIFCTECGRKFSEKMTSTCINFKVKSEFVSCARNKSFCILQYIFQIISRPIHRRSGTLFHKR